MNERQQATLIANAWLDGRMNALTQMVPGDPDCDACVLARQFLRAIETGWRTIDSAPQDQSVMLYEPNEPAMCQGWWSGDCWTPSHGNQPFFAPPTHWKPLETPT